MKVKFLSVLLAMTMVLSLLPTAALAEDGDENSENYVAETGGVQYANLQSAINAADNGATVKLLNDIDLELTVSVTKQITLDMNGKKLYNTKDLWDQPDAKANNWSLISVRESGDLTITGDGTLDAKENDCYAIDLQDETSKCTIENGTFVGNITAVYVHPGTLIINGGSFSIKQLNPNNVQDAYGLTINCYDADYKAGTAKVTITGGTFSHFNPADNKAEGASTSFCPSGYEATESGDNYIISVKSDNVAAIGNIEYATLTDAVTAANAGDTVTLLTDAAEDVVIPDGKDITLDLNGKTLTNAGSDTITNYGKLTVIGAGTVDNITHAKAALINNNNGTAVLSGGTFTRSKEAGKNPDNSGGNSYYTILNDKGGDLTINAGVKVVNSGHFSSMIRNGGTTGTTSTLLINGGSFSGGINTIKNDEGGTLTINDGDFSNTTQYVIMNWNVANIYNGTFEANSTASAVLFSSSWDGVGGTLNLYGGKVKTTGDSQEAICDHYDANNKGTVTVSGGYFTVDPTTYVADDHHTVASDTDGYTYMVVEGTTDDTTIIVADKVAADVENDVKDKEAVEAVIGKASVQNAAKALTDDAQKKLIADAGVNASELDESDTVTIVVNVAVKAVASDLTADNATLTFEATPTATVYVNGKQHGDAQAVTNDMLNGEITRQAPSARWLQARADRTQVRRLSHRVLSEPL